VQREASTIAEEAHWFLDRTRARRLVTVPLAQLDPRLLPDETMRVTLSREQTGCLVLPPEPIPLADRLGIRRSPRKRLAVSAGTPVLIAHGSHPYKKVLVAVGDDANANATTGVAVDIARQCDATLTSLTILPPSLLDGKSEEDDRKSLPLRIAKIARNHGLEVDRRVDEGNPLECIRRHASDFDLLVIGLSPRLRNSLLHPDISMYLMHDAPCSVLFVPGSSPSR
jgi:nucleotide-binding universal stress UspA family protein